MLNKLKLEGTGKEDQFKIPETRTKYCEQRCSSATYNRYRRNAPRWKPACGRMQFDFVR